MLPATDVGLVQLIEARLDKLRDARQHFLGPAANVL